MFRPLLSGSPRAQMDHLGARGWTRPIVAETIWAGVLLFGSVLGTLGG